LALAQRIGISEQELLARAQRLQNKGVVRNISPVLESRHLGLNAATLIALRVPEARIQEVAAVISSYPQVSHNFLRDHEYALWFTLSGKHAGEIDHVLKDILRSTGIPASDLLNLPTVQQRKVDVRFSFLNDEERRDLRGSA
jgi:DNA-binding Lrp family transcriptional regulator